VLQIESMIGTFLRVDIPVLGFVDDYVLYTDVDVMFARNLVLTDFAPLPKSDRPPPSVSLVRPRGRPRGRVVGLAARATPRAVVPWLTRVVARKGGWGVAVSGGS
jgi:hypothetical protein